MTLIQAIILGIIQGLTEFLPISSSAHLVLAPYLLGWQMNPQVAFTFDVLVQNGTLVAVILYFWKDLWGILRAFVTGLLRRKPFEDPQARLGWYILLATIPAGIFGLLIKPLVEAAFGSVVATAAFLFFTTALLLAAELIGKRTRGMEALNWRDALVMGFFQALSIFPGVSRSGSTIVGGMVRHLDRPTAARFSFLMSIPIMLAAGGLETIDMLGTPEVASYWPLIAAGFAAAAVVGYLSIHWLLGFLRKGSFVLFAVYCAVLGGVTLLVSALR